VKWAAVGIVLVSTLPAHAGDAVLGKAKAQACAACHGSKGISGNPLWPNIAGQKEQYLARQLRDYKTGARKDPQMAHQMTTLRNEDIGNLAAYFASLPSCK
jgi:cytochrome c553